MKNTFPLDKRYRLYLKQTLHKKYPAANNVIQDAFRNLTGKNMPNFKEDEGFQKWLNFKQKLS
jgi:hypothetical protein